MSAPIEPPKTRLPWPVTLYLWAVVLPLGFDLGPLALSLLRLLLLILTLPLMIRLFMGHFGRVRAWDILFVLHIFWAFLALAVMSPSRVIEQVGSVGVEFLGGYLIGRAYIRGPEAFAALARRLAFLVLLTLPFAIFENLTGRQVILDAMRALPGFHTVSRIPPDPRWGLERAQVVFAHAIHYGLFASLSFSMCYIGLAGFVSRMRRLVLSGLIIAATFASLSSGALLALVLQGGLILWARLFDRITWRWGLLLGLMALAYVAVDLASNRTPIRVFMSYATFSAHNAYWRAIIFEWGMKNVWMHPLFGLGMNDWLRPSFMKSGSMDNFWLVMAVRYGILGFLTVALAYALGLWAVMRRKLGGDARLLAQRRAWVFTFLGLAFTLSTVHVWTNIYSFVFFLFGAGLWLTEAVPGGAAAPAPAPAKAPRYSRFEGGAALGGAR
jgi:hypothetical protein